MTRSMGALIMVVAVVTAALAEPARAEERWRIEPAMMVHIRGMERAVKMGPVQTLEQHREISKVLDKELRELMAACTMTGEAHDALHEWLVPFMGQVREYGQEGNLAALDQSLDGLKASFGEFHRRFF